MIEMNVPGLGILQIEHLVCDLNGTLAVDGKLLEGIPRLLKTLSDRLTIHILTADTRGNRETIELQLGLPVTLISQGDETHQKSAFIERLGSHRVAAIGQGANDALMLKTAALGICVLSPEGTAIHTLNNAHLVVSDIYRALELFEKPLRLVASLRQ